MSALAKDEDAVHLLVVQLALLVWLLRIALRHTRGRVTAHSGVGRTLLVLDEPTAVLAPSEVEEGICIKIEEAMPRVVGIR